MRKIDARMHKRMPAVDRGRIGPMGGLLLMQLEELEPCSMQELAAAIGRDNSQLTRLIRGLEDKGVLARGECAQDGRVTVLTLTDYGRAFIAKAKGELTAVVDEVVAPLSAEDRDTLLRVLQSI
ncbi:MAG: MarR family transcriptional regulator [Pseudomonadota bacterium]